MSAYIFGWQKRKRQGRQRIESWQSETVRKLREQWNGKFGTEGQRSDEKQAERADHVSLVDKQTVRLAACRRSGRHYVAVGDALQQGRTVVMFVVRLLQVGRTQRGGAVSRAT